MKRYRIGQIPPEWRLPAPEQPIIRGASDRRGFATLSLGRLTLYRLGFPTAGAAVKVDEVRSLQVGEAKRYALGPGARMLAVANESEIALTEEGKEAPRTLDVAPGDVAALAFSASGKTLWAVVHTDGDEQGRLHAWDMATMQPLGNIQVLGPEDSVFELLVHPDESLERVGVDAAAGQEGSSFTFVERQEAELIVLEGSHDGPDGVALGGLAEDAALLISREAVVLINLISGDRLGKPARATLPEMKDEMIFDYLSGYIDDFWVVSGRFEDRDPDDVAKYPPEDAMDGRLRIYDRQLKEVLEMPSTDNLYDTPWAVVGLAQRRVLICQYNALMLYNLGPHLAG